MKHRNYLGKLKQKSGENIIFISPLRFSRAALVAIALVDL
jgi:hypothetical protein